MPASNGFGGIEPETREKYAESIAKFRDKEKNESVIRQQIKDELFKHFRGVIGVFGNFGYTYSDGVKGETIIDYSATVLCKNNPDFVIVTGRAHYIYDKERNEVIKDKPLQTILLEFIEQDYITVLQYSTILSSVCNYAIFLVEPNIRSTSLIEEFQFCKNIFEHNILGVFSYIVDNNVQEHLICDCFELENKIIETDKEFYLCKGIVKGEEEALKCGGIIHKVNYASIDFYVKSVFSRFVVTKNWDQIPKIFQLMKGSVS